MNNNILQIVFKNCLEGASNLPVMSGKIRNICNSILKCNKYKEGLMFQLSMSINEFETELDKYRIIMDKSTFDKLHYFKRATRNFLETYQK